jgi:apolipoprotein N-acyltransferase
VVSSGWLLTAYWWDFPPEDAIYDNWGIAFYSTLGVIAGVLLTAISMGFLLWLHRSRRSTALER